MITQDAYGHQVSFSTDGIIDTYLVGGSLAYTFPHGTVDGIVAVTLAIQANLVKFNSDLTDFINAHYTLESRVRWIALYMEFQAFNQPNKLAYVAQLLSWGNAISVYTATYVATVMAMTNPTTIVNTVFDPTQFAADPTINLLACMQISG